MIHRLLFSVLILSVFLSLGAAQGISTTIKGAEWGIRDFSAVRLGQLSVVHAPNGQELLVQALFDSAFFTLSSPSVLDGDCITVADYTTPFINRLGGTYDVFHSGGSTASIAHSYDSQIGAGLSVRYHKEAGEYSGLWMHLFNTTFPQKNRIFFDAITYSSLLIPIRGHSGSEQITIKIADDFWNRKEDALAIGDLGQFLPRGRIDTAWQTAVIPLGKLPPQIVASRLASLVLEPASPDSGIFELGPIIACRGGHRPQPKQTPVNRVVQTRESALWIWNTDELVRNKNAATELVDFLREQRIDHVFLALPYDAESSREGVAIDRHLMGPLVRIINAAGVKVHALVGDKDFVFPDKRSYVQNTMNNIAEYQKKAEPSDQFYGIHVDIEPHLLSGFNSPRQEWFLVNFLDVLALCAQTARENGLIIGADMPTWLDAMNELTHRPVDLRWRGVLKPVYQHVLDLMDNVALMDYRTKVEGDDGIILHAREELRYAENRGVKVFVGLETAPLFDETLIRFRGEPLTGSAPDESKQYVILQLRGETTVVFLVTGTEAQRFLSPSQQPPSFLWPVERLIPISGSRLSFSAHGRRLHEAIQESEPILSRWKSFAGFAFHHYSSYRTMVSTQK